VGGRTALAVLLLALAWASAGALAALAAARLAPVIVGEEMLSFLRLALEGLIGGLGTAAVLGWENRSLKLHQALIIVLGWALSRPLTWYFSLTVGGFVTALVARRVHPRLGLRGAGAITLGWLAGWGIPALVLNVLPIPPADLVTEALTAAAVGLISGGIGGGFMLQQLANAGWGTAGAPPDQDSRLISDLMRHLERNPVMDRLVKSSIEAQIYIIVGAAFGVGAGGLLLSMSIWARLRSNLPEAAFIPFLIYILTLTPTARVPMVVSSIAALLTATDASKQQFDLLRLTPISGRELSWAYTLAPLRLLRGLLSFEYIVMLLMFSGALCVYLPALPLANNVALIATAACALMAGVGLVGLNLLAAAIGVRIALLYREVSRSALIAPVLTLAVTLVILIPAITGLSSVAANPSLQALLGFVFFMILPYVAALELMDTAHPWKRFAISRP